MSMNLPDVRWQFVAILGNLTNLPEAILELLEILIQSGFGGRVFCLLAVTNSKRNILPDFKLSENLFQEPCLVCER